MSLTNTSNRLSQFIKENQETWSRLQEFLRQKSLRNCTKGEIDEFGRMYRQISAHLAYAQTCFPSHEITAELRQLVMRAHNILYGAPETTYGKKVWLFYRDGFPKLFYERRFFVLTAALLLFAGFLFAFVATCLNHDAAAFFLPSDLAGNIDPQNIGKNDWNDAIVSSQIMINNIQVAFTCFAMGIFLAIGTIWSLFMNGLLLGALSALYSQAGGDYPFWAFILPHGVIELTAIFISGAAGLSLAYRLFVPGDFTRKHALIREGLVTIKLMAGVIPMFIIAGIIEGYVTPAHWPHWTKYAVAIFNLLWLSLYFGRPFFAQQNPDES
ncbi:stage II sporulation protein M [Thermoactinomyces daqus]|uniref:Stage II sporulation protein M n=1 Tax=Thermoactinomyces daqus TaxID=1329516 RepID=A0A7W2AJ17_9BACL|nr:stage II sporulation protein M [Thermoactinomyces daqus]MBA4544351.1 stage II sporulation protein M [Thermoactinomyces daqus]